MGATTLTTEVLLPGAELAHLARILARFLVGRQTSAAGNHTMGRLAGQGQDFLDFRQYQPGDDFRSIDWQASARSPRIQVRRHCSDVASDWYLCVDASASVGVGAGANWLLARQLSAALAYVLLHLGHRVGMLLFSDEIEAACPLGRGHGQYARILRTLNSHGCRIRGGGSDLGVCATIVGQRNPILVVSDFLAEDGMVTALTKLQHRQRQLHLFQLNAVSHCQLPAVNRVLLEDIETGRMAMSGEPDVAEHEASLRLQALQRDLAAWCRRFRVPLTRCDSGDNWRDLLLRHFMRV